MAYSERNGFGKPMLRLDPTTGELIVGNVPVPKLRWSLSRAIDRADLRSVDLLRRLIGRLSPSRPAAGDTVEATAPVARRTLLAVQESADAREVVALFVLLPTEADLADDVPWRAWALPVLRELDVLFLDLTPALRRLPATRAAEFFIPPSEPGDGHYTAAGNQWVAATIHAELLRLVDMQALTLSQRGRNQGDAAALGQDGRVDD
jgi:hypothetical protein